MMVRKLLGAATWVGLFLVGTVIPLHAQLLSFGVKGGIPLTDPLTTGQGSSGGITHDVSRYIVGATGEVHLPLGLSLEVDALYRRFSYNGVFTGANVAVSELPGWMQAISQRIPLTHGIRAAREIAAGASLSHVSGLILTELAIGAVYMAVGYYGLRLMELSSRRSASIQIA